MWLCFAAYDDLLLMMPNHDDADDAVTDVRHDDAAGLVFL